MHSPYTNKDFSEWQDITDSLIAAHPLSEEEIVAVVLKSWEDIFTSKIGLFSIGKDIFPSPQIISFFLHELIAHYISSKHKAYFRVGVNKNEKDVHHILNSSLSIEIKCSSNSTQIFGNRSYAQPNLSNANKEKDGYYITVNFSKFSKSSKELPLVRIIRFGYLEHSDWVAQIAATGQQARLRPEAYKYKLKTIYLNS